MFSGVRFLFTVPTPSDNDISTWIKLSFSFFWQTDYLRPLSPSSNFTVQLNLRRSCQEQNLFRKSLSQSIRNISVIDNKGFMQMSSFYIVEWPTWINVYWNSVAGNHTWPQYLATILGHHLATTWPLLGHHQIQEKTVRHLDRAPTVIPINLNFLPT